jgi:hypothetical protein
MLELTEEQRSELNKWASSRTLAVGDVFRARLILALAEGRTYNEIMQRWKRLRRRFCVGSKGLKRMA